MKNYKPTVEVSVGNPAKEGETYLIFYETGNKIAYRVRVKEAYLGFDNKNNFVIKGEGFISDLKDFNIKSENLKIDSTNSSETTKNKEINTSSMNINVVEDFNIRANKFLIDAEEILLRGKTTVGDITNIEKETGEDKTKDIYDYDAVMTVNKFKYFYDKKFIPFFNWVVKSFNTYNQHTHGYAPTDLPVRSSPEESGKIKKSELIDLQNSQTLKIL